MRLRRLVTEGFRNLEPSDLSVPAQFVVLTGPNAHGKTNTLEAIHVIASLKALRGRRIGQLVAWGSSEAAVAGWVEHHGIERHYRIDLTRTGRTTKLDGKRVSNLEEYFAGVRAIAFTPSDGQIVAGEPSRRRAWVDRAAFTAAPAHLGRVRAFRQVLQQKGAVLRGEKADVALLDVLDQQLVQLGSAVVEHRLLVLEELRPHVEALHASIANSPGDIEIRYHTRAQGDDPHARRQALADRLAEVRSRELDRRTTLAGPQLDDVRISIGGRPAREFASRGQIRSIVLSLKLGEMVAARERGDVPIFLIDDASTELDAGRTGRLVARLSDLGAQVFATTTDAGPLLAALPAEDTLVVDVLDGSLSPRGG